MLTMTELPHILAAINLATVSALSAGFVFIRRGERAAHRRCMLVAVALGAAFMVLYLTYHFGAGLAKFGGHGAIRPIYFTLLTAHIVAAAAATPLVPIALFRALSDRIDGHRHLAPWALSVWLFVAVSGLVVYAMTVHIYPYRGAQP